MRLRALLPSIIRFAYVPRTSIQVNPPVNKGTGEPDYSERSERVKSAYGDDEDHVLTLEFAETWGGGETDT
jgi:hypothetical protein